MRRSLLLSLLVLLSLSLVAPEAFAKKKKKGKEPEAPPVGELFVGDMPCYAPPDFAPMNEGTRRMERQKGFQVVNKLVTGEATNKAGEPLVKYKIENDDYDYFERAFLGRPQLLDDWLTDNFERCSAVGNGKMKADAYISYLAKIGREFEANECYKPLDYEWHDFLDVAQGWQRRLHTCKGNRILVETTGEENGQYTITDTGKMANNTFITAIGDPNTPQAGDVGLVPELPLGAVVMRFQAEDDSYTKYFLVGAQLKWTAPDHGFLSFSVNDTTYFDNKFRDIKGAVDYLGVDVYPEEKKE